MAGDEKADWVLRVVGVDVAAAGVPEAPDGATRQTRALSAAADAGVPFCEECGDPAEEDTADEDMAEDGMAEDEAAEDALA